LELALDRTRPRNVVASASPCSRVTLGTVRRWAVCLGFVLLLGLSTTPALAAANVPVRALLTDDGSGQLVVDDPAEGWSWEVCQADLSNCSSFGSGREISIGPAVPEAVFRVFGSDGTGVSPVWHGSLDAVELPSVEGPVRANALITPIAATWSGGWDGDFDQTQLAACATPTGGRCTTLTDPRYGRGCADGATVLDPVFTGQYLRVADMRIGPGMLLGPAPPMVPDVTPYGHQVWRGNGRISVTLVGRIGRADGPRAARCGPPPLDRASISSTGRVTVSCGLGCRALVVARHSGHTAALARQLPKPRPLGTGRKTRLQFSARVWARLGPGPVQVVVRLDGMIAARRTVIGS
jgi:hypothetical protein